MLPETVIAKYYEPYTRLWNILVTHSRSVADLAVAIVDAHPELAADRQFVFEAAMLHDIGIIGTNAPDLGCFGDKPYICHGTIGSEMLRSEGLPLHALVAERHTGSGLSLDYILANDLPVPHRDLLPVSVEEKIVCYADKFFSKTKHLTVMKSYEKALKSCAKYGDESRERFLDMDKLFRIPEIKPSEPDNAQTQNITTEK